MLSIEDFWNHIDKINPYESLKQLCIRANINYNTICKQRTHLYMPKPETLLQLAQALGVSIECLLTGEDSPAYSDEIEEIARWLKLFGTEEDFRLIRRVLGMPGKNNTVSNKKMS